MIEIVKPDFIHNDERGMIAQLIHDGYKQVNVMFSKAGSVRGRMHYHKRNSELIYVLTGEIVCDSSAGEHLAFSAGDMFRIPPQGRACV